MPFAGLSKRRPKEKNIIRGAGERRREWRDQRFRGEKKESTGCPWRSWKHQNTLCRTH